MAPTAATPTPSVGSTAAPTVTPRPLEVEEARRFLFDVGAGAIFWLDTLPATDSEASLAAATTADTATTLRAEADDQRAAVDAAADPALTALLVTADEAVTGVEAVLPSLAAAAADLSGATGDFAAVWASVLQVSNDGLAASDPAAVVAAAQLARSLLAEPLPPRVIYAAALEAQRAAQRAASLLLSAAVGAVSDLVTAVAGGGGTATPTPTTAAPPPAAAVGEARRFLADAVERFIGIVEDNSVGADRRTEAVFETIAAIGAARAAVEARRAAVDAAADAALTALLTTADGAVRDAESLNPALLATATAASDAAADVFRVFSALEDIAAGAQRAPDATVVAAAEAVQQQERVAQEQEVAAERAASLALRSQRGASIRLLETAQAALAALVDALAAAGVE